MSVDADAAENSPEPKSTPTDGTAAVPMTSGVCESDGVPAVDAAAVAAPSRLLPPNNRHDHAASAAARFRGRRIIEPTPGPKGGDARQDVEFPDRRPLK